MLRGFFILPGDTEQIVPVDAQKLLLVKSGDDEDFRRLQELVKILDQPQRQIELEAKVVEMSPADAKTFGIDFAPQPNESKDAEASAATNLAPQIGFVRNNHTARLNALVADNRAKVFSAPPATLSNNTLGKIPLSSTIVVVNPNEAPRPLQFFTSLKGQTLNVVPTINGDDTISLHLDVIREPQNTGETADETATTFVANLRDGDTIALSGLRASIFSREKTPPFPMLNEIPLINSTTPSSLAELNQIPIIGRLFRSKKPEDERTTLVFITARILRPTEK